MEAPPQQPEQPQTSPAVVKVKKRGRPKSVIKTNIKIVSGPIEVRFD